MENRLLGRLRWALKAVSHPRARRRTSSKLALAVACGLCVNGWRVRAAHSEPPPALRIVGAKATCPTVRQVKSELERILPRTSITVESGPANAPEATISEQGTQFRVTIAGQERSFDDAARQCDERARQAAVFLALVLDPLLMAELSAEPRATRTPAATPAVASRAPSEPKAKVLQWEMTLGGVVHVAPGVSGRETAVAPGLALFTRAKRGLHLALGAGFQTAKLRFDIAEADAWWIPIDVAVGIQSRANAWEIGAEIGPSARVLSVVGVNLKEASPHVRIDLGARASAWSRFWFGEQFGVFFSAETVLRPFPHMIDIDPRGSIGQTPPLWLGASAGIAASL
jgi:hypothetical protein